MSRVEAEDEKMITVALNGTALFSLPCGELGNLKISLSASGLLGRLVHDINATNSPR